MEVKLQGDKLTITVSLVKPSAAENSKSGKSLVLFSTHGNQAIALPGEYGQCQIGLNIYKRN